MVQASKEVSGNPRGSKVIGSGEEESDEEACEGEGVIGKDVAL